MNVARFEHQAQLDRIKNQEQREHRRRAHNINGFEAVQKIHEQMLMHTAKSGAPLSSERQRAPRAFNQSGVQHSTHRSMGIESYCQKKETDSRKPLVGQAGSYIEGKNFSAMAEIQEKSETLCN